MNILNEHPKNIVFSKFYLFSFIKSFAADISDLGFIPLAVCLIPAQKTVCAQ